jgi:hypothetical protein
MVGQNGLMPLYRYSAAGLQPVDRLALGSHPRRRRSALAFVPAASKRWPGTAIAPSEVLKATENARKPPIGVAVDI